MVGSRTNTSKNPLSIIIYLRRNIKMDSHSQETLRMVQENDDTLTRLLMMSPYSSSLYDDGGIGGFNSSRGSDFLRLGAAIGENTHVTSLTVTVDHITALEVTDDEFYDGLKQNSSIQFLNLHCQNSNIAGGVGQRILEVYQANNNLTELCINNAGLQHGGEISISETMRSCTNLMKIGLRSCNITDEQLLPIFEAVREHCSLEEMDLADNRIGMLDVKQLLPYSKIRITIYVFSILE